MSSSRKRMQSLHIEVLETLLQSLNTFDWLVVVAVVVAVKPELEFVHFISKTDLPFTGMQLVYRFLHLAVNLRHDDSFLIAGK